MINVKIDKQLIEFELPVRSTIGDLKAKMLEQHPEIVPRLQFGGYDLDENYLLDGISASEHLTQGEGLLGGGETSSSLATSWRDSHCNLCWLQYFHGRFSRWRPACHCTNFNVDSRGFWEKRIEELDEEFAPDVAEMKALYYEEYCPDLECAQQLPCFVHGFAKLVVHPSLFDIVEICFNISVIRLRRRRRRRRRARGCPSAARATRRRSPFGSRFLFMSLSWFSFCLFLGG